MKLEDVDFELQNEFASITLSQLTQEDIDQINKVADAIQMQNIFRDRTIAIIAGFNLYLQSIAATNDWIAEGGRHH